MFLPFILFFLTFFSLAIFLFVVLASRTRHKQLKIQNSSTPRSSITTATEDGKFRIVSFVYFALIGFAFMFAEIFFIHRLILFFGSPVKAFSMTIVTILLSAGLGSLASGWVAPRKFVWITGLAPLFIAVCAILFGRLDETPLYAVLIIPVGIVLGLFFPTGIKFLAGGEQDSVPLAYASNGAASVIAPSLASLLAVSYGCNVLLILAAILYTLALVIVVPVALRMLRTVQYS
jgi:hypothetical protein